MRYRFGSDNPAKAAMHHVEGIVRQVESYDERIVSACRYDERYQVDDRQSPGTIAEVGQHRRASSLLPIDCNCTQSYVHSYDSGNEKALEPRRNAADTPPLDEPYFTVVPCAEKRGVDEVSLQEGIPSDRVLEARLPVFVRAGELSHISNAEKDKLIQGEGESEGSERGQEIGCKLQISSSGSGIISGTHDRGTSLEFGHFEGRHAEDGVIERGQERQEG